jgi:hypothetical protein
MRQGFAVTALLVAVGLPTVFIAEGGWQGVQHHWLQPAASFVISHIPSQAGSEFGGAAQASTGPALRHDATGSTAGTRALASADGNVLLESRPTIDPFLVHAKPTATAGGDSHVNLATDIKRAAFSADRAAATVKNTVAPTDYGSAVRWYTLAAEPDNADVRYGMARDYLDAPEPNLAVGVHWLLSAAELGHPRAQLEIGGMYIEGNGVRRDYVAAFKWLSLAQDGLANGDELVLAVDKLSRLSRAMTPDEIADAAVMIEQWQPKSFAQGTHIEPGMATTLIASGG